MTARIPLLAVSLSLTLTISGSAADADAISWKKTVVSKAFLSEGVAIADVNKDGKMDVLTGELWFEAPDWKPHRIRPGKDDYAEGDKNVYSKSFTCWTDDLNGDSYADLIVVGFPGAPCHWYENPQGKDGLWKEHVIWHSACNETPLYADLFGTGKRVLLMGWQPKGKDNEGQMAWFTPAKNPTELWEMHPISNPSEPGKPVPGTFRFAHGLGIGDVNGDGKLDVITTGGWWEQARGTPSSTDSKTPWKFHPARLGDACADMFAFDLDGDGKPDILSSSAHNYGIWWHQQKSDSEFLTRPLFPKLVSQTHAMHFVDMNGDGLKDLVTGKRWWAHGSKGDADPNLPAMLYWFAAKKGKDGIIEFVPHEIDNDSGIGTQFVVADFNGDKLLDVIVANKKGVFVHEQVRKAK